MAARAGRTRNKKPLMDFAVRLKNSRESQGLTQDELARETWLSIRTIKLIENATRYINLNTTTRVRLDTFFGGDFWRGLCPETYRPAPDLFTLESRIESLETRSREAESALAEVSASVNESIGKLTAGIQSHEHEIHTVQSVLQRVDEDSAAQASELEALSDAVNRLRITTESIVDQLKKHQVRVARTLEARVETVEHALDKMSWQFDDLESELVTLKLQLAAQNSAIAEQGEQIRSLQFESAHRAVLDSTLRFWWSYGGWVSSRQTRSALLSFKENSEMESPDFQELVSNRFLTVDNEGQVSIADGSIWQRLSTKVYLVMAMAAVAAFSFLSAVMDVSLGEAIVAFFVSTVFVCVSQYKIDTAGAAKRVADHWRIKLGCITVV